jgi:hypothetical protein
MLFVDTSSPDLRKERNPAPQHLIGQILSKIVKPPFTRLNGSTKDFPHVADIFFFNLKILVAMYAASHRFQNLGEL